MRHKRGFVKKPAWFLTIPTSAPLHFCEKDVKGRLKIFSRSEELLSILPLTKKELATPK
jgi:hypothetical protein